MKPILVVDNHDSFVFNLVQYLLELGADCTVKDSSDVALGDPTRMDGIITMRCRCSVSAWATR